jgi:ATP-dependent exoDNAse (exonuclease V) beta subunit
MTRYLSSKSWHFLSKHWQRVFGLQAEAAMTEALCLLYVAMTRARQALYLVIQPPRKSGFDQRTASSLVYHALGCQQDPTQGGVTLFETGDRDWCVGDEVLERVTDAAPPKQVAINFRPVPKVPHRNSSRDWGM